MSTKETWVPANGGSEVPFLTRTGKKIWYMFCPTLKIHAYYCVDNDTFLSDEEVNADLP